MSDQETTRLGVNEVDASEASARPSTSPAAVVERESEPASKEDLNRRDPLAETQAELAKIRDQLLRTAADFDNYRKRARKEAEDAQRKGSEELLRALLPVFDNLERAVLHAEQSADAKAIADGVRMVLKQFTDTLARVGIARVATVGQAFDPLVHEAIQQVETSDASPGAIVAEVAPGYRFGDRLVRAAMVVVAKSPSPKEDVVDEIAS